MPNIFQRQDLGVLFLKVAGIEPWSSDGKFKTFISYVYIIHSKLSFVFLISMEFILPRVKEDFDTKLKFIWRTAAVASILLQNLSVTYNSRLLRHQIYDLVKDSEFNINLNEWKKKAILKLSSFLLLVLMFMLLFFIRKMVLADSLVDNVNNSIEDVIPSLISNPVLSQAVRVLIMLSINHLTITKFGHDCVLVYLLVLTQGHAEQFKVEAAKVQISGQNPRTEREMVTLSCNIKFCILLHQHVIRMVDTLNTVFSTSLLLLVWRAILMSVVAYELTKGGDHLVSATEVSLLFSFSVWELVTTCWLAQSVADKVSSVTGICMSHVEELSIPSEDVRMRAHMSSMLVMATRCRLPLEVLAGPFYTLSVNTFATILGLTFSYFTFLFTLSFEKNHHGHEVLHHEFHGSLRN